MRSTGCSARWANSHPPPPAKSNANGSTPAMTRRKRRRVTSDALQRHPHLNQAGDAATLVHGPGSGRAPDMALTPPQWSRRSVHPRGGPIMYGVRAQRQPSSARGSDSCEALDRSKRMAPFHVTIPGRKPEEAPKDRLNIRWDGRRRLFLGKAAPRQCQRHPLQGHDRCHATGYSPIAHRPCRRESEDRNGQEAGIPQGETSADGTRAHSSLRLQYIADPRIVRSNSGSRSASTFLRK